MKLWCIYGLRLFFLRKIYDSAAKRSHVDNTSIDKYGFYFHCFTLFTISIIGKVRTALLICKSVHVKFTSDNKIKWESKHQRMIFHNPKLCRNNITPYFIPLKVYESTVTPNFSSTNIIISMYVWILIVLAAIYYELIFVTKLVIRNTYFKRSEWKCKASEERKRYHKACEESQIKTGQVHYRPHSDCIIWNLPVDYALDFQPCFERNVWKARMQSPVSRYNQV